MINYKNPIYSEKIGADFIVWFRASNNYIILNELLMKVYSIFIKSSSLSSFLTEVEQDLELDYDTQKATDLYQNFTEFIKDQNLKGPLEKTIEVNFSDSRRAFNETYSIEKHIVLIHYSSEYTKGLIHPKLMHLICNIKTKNKPTTVFDIYEEDNNLYLFKDEIFIGTYELFNSHLLQGRFAMEFLCVLHNKEEHDWLGTFHASTVSNGKEAIMLIGDSGNGKSTFSALLMASGLDLMADDITPVLAADKQVYKCPSAISIKQGAFELLNEYYPGFELLPKFKGSAKKGLLKYIAPKQNGTDESKKLPCSKIVYIKYDKEQDTTLSQSAADKVLRTLIPDSWISPKEENAKQFLNWLQDMSYYELKYSDNELAVSEFKKLFDA